MSPHALSRVLILAIGVLAHATASAQDHQGKLDRVLREAARSAAPAPHRVIVQVRPGARAELVRTLRAHGDTVEAEHPGLNALTATVHHADLAALAANPLVVSVSADVDVTSFGGGGGAISKKSAGAPGGLNVLRASLGLVDGTFLGRGVTVAILDSGIEANRDLAPAIAGFWDFTRGGIPTRPYDDYGHGTHLAGLIASQGSESSSEYAGVAPGVRLYGLKVLDKVGRGRSSDVVKALEWIAANKRSAAPGAVKIDIVNLSLGHPVYEPAETDPLVRAVENVVRAGVIVVAAAGNKGQDENGDPGYAGISSPGNAPSAITVGAVDTKNTADRSDDRVAYFSSRGPTWFDGFAKPEIVAPGVALTSDAAERGELYDFYPQLRLGGRYRRFARLSGTSLAAATATGVASVALEASRSARGGVSLPVNVIKAILQYTALPVAGADGQPFEPLAQGAGQVNGDGAIALALGIDAHPFSVIAGDTLAWSRALVWKDSVITGSDALAAHSQLWDDNIVWGTGCDTDAAECLASVWGAAAQADNIVWGTSLGWADEIVFANRLVGLLADGDNIVWGTLAGLTEDNIVWGTYIDDNIVWGTLARRDASGAPLWGAIADDNIVWGTLRGDDLISSAPRGDNIVWGTLRGDNIVWGTFDGSEGRRR